MLCPRVYPMNLRFIKNNTPKVWSWGRAEGVKGAIADFVCFHCPLVASEEAKSPRNTIAQSA